MASDKKKDGKAKAKKKTFGAVVLHTHKHGSDTYICTTSKVAWAKAAQIALSNLDEFVDGETVSRDGIDFLESLLDGDNSGAVDIYSEFMADKSENIEVDPKVEILDDAEKFDKKILRSKLAELMELKKGEPSSGEEETKAEDDEEDEAEGGDSDGSAQVTNSAAGGVAAGSYGGQSDATSQGAN